jgi:hypothetical protein
MTSLLLHEWAPARMGRSTSPEGTLPSPWHRSYHLNSPQCPLRSSQPQPCSSSRAPCTAWPLQPRLQAAGASSGRHRHLKCCGLAGFRPRSARIPPDPTTVVMAGVCFKGLPRATVSRQNDVLLQIFVIYACGTLQRAAEVR